jgi:hypothetical protein
MKAANQQTDHQYENFSEHSSCQILLALTNGYLDELIMFSIFHNSTFEILPSGFQSNISTTFILCHNFCNNAPL